MTPENARRLLNAYLDGELDAASIIELEAQMRESPALQQELSVYRRYKTWCKVAVADSKPLLTWLAVSLRLSLRLDLSEHRKQFPVGGGHWRLVRPWLLWRFCSGGLFPHSIVLAPARARKRRYWRFTCVL